MVRCGSHGEAGFGKVRCGRVGSGPVGKAVEVWCGPVRFGEVR